MRQELDNLLSHRYHEINIPRPPRRPGRNRHVLGLPKRRRLGFEIIDGLYAEITRQVKASAMPLVVAKQVKEKSGYLRFYIRDHFNRDANPQAHRIIELAQRQANHMRQLRRTSKEKNESSVSGH